MKICLKAFLLGVGVFCSMQVFASDSLISNILKDPNETVVGQWIVETSTLSQAKNKDYFDINGEPLSVNSCVRINVIRDEKDGLWVQQVTIRPIKSKMACERAMEKTLD